MNLTVYQFKIKNKTPLIIGTGEDGIEGIYKQDGLPVIPGTSLGGAYRDFIKKSYRRVYRKLYKEDSEEKQEKLPILFHDIELGDKDIRYENLYTYRNRVEIDNVYNTAKDKSLVTEYQVNIGNDFLGTVELKDVSDDFELRDSIEEFIAKLVQGKIGIGKNSSLGFGKFNSTQQYLFKKKEFDFSKKEEFDLYLEYNPKEELKLGEEVADYKGKRVINDSIEIIFSGKCEDGLFIGGKSERKDEKKIGISFNENGISKIPASTIKGFFRANVEKILSTLNIFNKTEIVEIMFGSEDKKGVLYFEDVELLDGKKIEQNRIKIDRFTGGVFTGGNFNNEIITSNKVEIKVSMKKTNGSEDGRTMSLIAIVMRELGYGNLSIGYGKNVGYGKIVGEEIKIIGEEVEDELMNESEKNIIKYRFHKNEENMRFCRHINSRRNF